MSVVINGTTGIDTGTGSLIAADSTTPTYLDLFEDTDNGSNYVRLIAPTSVASNRTLTLPDGTGTFVVNGVNGSLVSGTAVASTSGTSIDFTSIPSWVKRITVMLGGVSTSGTANIWIQIGSGSVETTGYTTNAGRVSGTSCTTFSAISTAFIVSSVSAASDTQHGTLILSLLGSNLWTFTGTCLNPNGPLMHYVAGTKTTSGTLDRVRVTTSNGTDTFDAGTINILYE